MGTENGRRKCGRKKSKSNEAKIPQRGMGVAQLEWHRRHPSSGDGSSKREISNQNPNMFHSFAPQTPHPYGPNSYFSTDPSVAATRSLGSGLNQQQQQGLVVQRLGPNGLVLGQGQSSGFGYVYPDQFPVLDQYGVGAPQYSYNYQQPTTGNMNMSSTCEMSKDMMISYVPNMQCFPAGTVCPKKKRYCSGEISESGVVTAKDSYGSTFMGSPMISSCAAKGTYNLGDCGTTKLSSMHPHFPGPKINDIQDAVAVHDCKAKGSLMGGSRNMLMEYEFFPAENKLEKGEKSSIFKDWIKLGSESSSAGYGEANSCLTTTNTSVAFGGASSSIDLSLKLSNY